MKNIKMKFAYVKPTIFYIGIALIVQSILMGIFSKTHPHKTIQYFNNFMESHAVIITTITLLFMFAILISRKSVRKVFREQTSNKLTYKYLYLVVFGVVLSICGSLFASLFINPNTNVSSTYNGTLPLKILGLVILAPLVEEVLFRGLTYIKIKEDMGVTVAMAISTVLFTLVHLSDLKQASFDMVLGLCLIAVYEIYHDLKATILTHLVCNLTSVICNEMNWTIHQSSKIITILLSVLPILLALYELNALNRGENNE